MSNWDVELEFVEGTSSKFWRARVDGSTLYVNYGRIGSAGQTQPKDFPSQAVAQKEFDKLVAEKRKKGYVDAGGTAASVDEDEVDDDREPDDEDDDDVPAIKPAARPAPAAAPRVPGLRMQLDAGGRKVEATLYLDGKTVRMDSAETHANPDAAKKAHDRLKRLLAAEGYKEG